MPLYFCAQLKLKSYRKFVVNGFNFKQGFIMLRTMFTLLLFLPGLSQALKPRIVNLIMLEYEKAQFE